MNEANDLLLKSAESGDLEGVKIALEWGANVNIQDDLTKQSALHKASRKGHVMIVEYLLKNGANLSLRDTEHMTALHIATRDGSIELAKCILEMSEKIPESILSEAVDVGYLSATGNKALVKMIEDYKITMATPNTGGSEKADRQLLEASHDGNLEGVKSALKKDANVEVTDERGMKAIHWAALRGHTNIVALLLEKGADFNGKNVADWTPLMHSSLEGHIEIVKLLLNKGAQVNAMTPVSGTALLFASWNGHEEIVKLLLSAGADPTIELSGTDRDDGATAIDFARRTGHMSIVNLLLKSQETLDDAE